ncbi:MAG: hypothetical protein MR732_07955 [Alistipes sp.]|nr:hypothetical protein [Alistipes sp.]MDY5200262.1 hypothetical protein [Candidatus Cryptobacteroides sp.]
MLYHNTLNEITSNINTGVEYEIALFYKLLENKPAEQKQVMSAIQSRYDAAKVKSIITYTDTNIILSSLNKRGLEYVDAAFETQNDEVGPADIVLITKDNSSKQVKIGLSVKYANTCTLNVTGRNFITDSQISELRAKLPNYTQDYINEMTATYGDVSKWFRMRKPSRVTDAYIDLIRDSVISNWKNVHNKTSLLSALFHSDSPIEFWVVTYTNTGYTLKTKPQTIDMRRAGDVTVGKYQTSYVAFYLDGVMVGHMQVKFNNGFVEKCKKINPDVVCQGVKMAYGQPFSSWNFSVEK